MNRLDDKETVVRFSAWANDFHLLQTVYTCPETHPASHTKFSGAFTPGGKAPCKCRLSFISSQCQGQECVDLYLHRFTCLHDVHSDNFDFTSLDEFQAPDA
jgi:hypothetical protein